MPRARLTPFLLACATLLAFPAAGAAHESPSVADAEAAALGPAHAAEHAAQRRAARRWSRMSPRERARLVRRGERATLAFARTAAVAPANLGGAWEPTPQGLPGYAINAVLLPTGKILYWDRAPVTIPPAGRRNTSHAYLWNPSAPGTPPEDVTPPPFDINGDGRADNVPIFCSGQSLLPSGEVFAAGGTLELWSETHNWKGAKFALTFDPWTKRWTRQPDMRHGRWYPGQVELPDGRIAVVSGLDETGDNARNSTNVELEVFTPSPVRGGRGSWARYDASNVGWDGKPGRATPGFYPHLFSLPSGKVLMVGPMQADAALLDPARLPTAGSAWTDLPDLLSYHATGNAVLMPAGPAGARRVGIVGGYLNQRSIRTAETGALSGPPNWTHVGAMLPAANADRLPDWQVPRSNANLVQLPDGALLTVGGAAGIAAPYGQNWMGTPPDQRLRQPELYRPGRDRAWQLGPPQRKWRGYHSTALLLPDGRVLSAGDDYWSPTNAPDPTVGRDLAEIYRPPYLFAKGGGAAPRPRITSAPPTLRVGGTFHVGVTGRPARAVLMAPAAVTHGNDMNQRHVELRVVSRSSRRLTLQAPPSAGVAPPGWYMLFVLDGHGTPSMARWVRITADATRPRLSASLAAPVRRGRPAWLRVALGEPGTVRVDARAGRRRTGRTLIFTVAGRARRVAIAVPRRARVKVRLEARDVALNRTTRTLRSHG